MNVTKLKNGLYSCKVYLGTENGKKVYKRVKGRTEKEARSAAKKLKAQYILTPEQLPAGTSLTLRQAINVFIDTRSNILSPSTVRGYVSIRDNSFRSIMDVLLDQISEEAVQREINFMALKLAPKTIKNKLALFTSVYNAYAERPKKWALNVPQKQKADIYIPSRSDVDTVINYCRSAGPYQELFIIPIMLGAFMGLRRGEIGALTWKDVDLNAGILSVTKSMVKDGSNSYVIKAPKTFNSYRWLIIPPIVLNELKTAKTAQKRLVGLNIDQITDGFPVILKNAGVPPFRFHDLRHFFASELLALNVPDLYAIKLTGHSTTNMLKTVYQHTMPEEERRIQNAINEAFTEKQKTK